MYDFGRGDIESSLKWSKENKAFNSATYNISVLGENITGQGLIRNATTWGAILAPLRVLRRSSLRV